MTEHAVSDDSTMAGHVLPLRTYLAVFAALLAATALTVTVAYVDLGPFNAAVALAIAGAKGLLVILWFMHVKYQPRLVWVFVAAGFVWLVLLLGFTLGDYLTRSPVSAPWS